VSIWTHATYRVRGHMTWPAALILGVVIGVLLILVLTMHPFG
jgi:hypothetical protein